MRAALVTRIVLWSWFAAALAVGNSGLLRGRSVVELGAVIFGLTVALLAAYSRVPVVREWVDAIDLRRLVLFHVTRYLGVYLLVLFQRGVLPRAFAVPAGIGDILVATIALLIALAPLEFAARLRATAIWNVVGLMNLLLVLFTAARLHSGDLMLLQPMLLLPLSLLPTLLVPLWLATHIIIFLRAARERPTAQTNNSAS